MDLLPPDPLPPIEVPPLLEGEVHLWTIDPGALAEDVVASLQALLSADELAKAQRYRRVCDRRQSIVARGMLRRALSTYRDAPPAAWRFEVGEHGKPALAGGERDEALSFNVSHTHGCIAIAVAHAPAGAADALGVDVEDIARSSDIERIASRFFAPREVAQLRDLSDEAFCERFFAFWTLKEAYIKARGLGLAIPLQEFWFDLGEAEPSIGFSPQIDDEAGSWRFARHALGARHRLAVALRTPGELVLRFVG